MNGSGWFVAYTKPGSENKAKMFLEGNGAEVYLPMFARTMRHAGSTSTKPYPVFPRYLFFRRLPLAVARTQPGVSNIVRRGIDFVVVPDFVVDSLREKEVGGLIELNVVPTHTPPPLRNGERVRVKDGPFKDKIAIYQGMSPHQRVSVLLAVLHRSIRVDLPAKAVVRE